MTIVAYSQSMQDRAKYFEELARKSDLPSVVTNPLFEVSRGRQECVASCVLIAVGPQIALVTAAHALKSGGIFKFGAGNQLLPVVGRARATLPPTDEPDDVDFIDLKCVLLDEMVASRIDRQFVLELGQIETETDILVDGPYLAVGYPYSKQKSYRWRRENAAKNHQLILRREPHSAYAEEGFDPLGTIITHFDKEDVFRSGKSTVAPDPFGMSGGSLWKLSCENPDLPKLAGILIRWHHNAGGRKILATRAHVALQMLLELEQSLGQWIGVSDSAISSYVDPSVKILSKE